MPIGACWWYDALQVIAFRELDLIYVVVPKAGLTSLNAALHAHDGSAPWGTSPIHGDIQFDRWKARRFPYAYVFTVVRDPVERFESMFYDKVNYGDINTYAIRFSEDAMATNPHGRRQSQLVGRLAKFDFIGHTEDMATVGATLSDITGHTIVIGHANRSNRGPKLRGEGLAAIQEHFREDYRLFGYVEGVRPQV